MHTGVFCSFDSKRSLRDGTVLLLPCCRMRCGINSAYGLCVAYLGRSGKYMGLREAPHVLGRKR